MVPNGHSELKTVIVTEKSGYFCGTIAQNGSKRGFQAENSHRHRKIAGFFCDDDLERMTATLLKRATEKGLLSR